MSGLGTQELDAAAGVDASVSAALARWACGLTTAELSEPARRQATILLLDVLGVAVAGTTTSVAPAAAAFARTKSAGPCSVLVRAQGAEAADAALLNGVIIHATELDDGFGGHASACLWPVVFACAQIRERSDLELLLAYVAGMEVFNRLAQNTPGEKIHEYGFHPTSVYGLLAGTVVAARILGTDETRTAHALGIAASSGCGVTANFGTTTKPLHVGMVAASAVRAVELAEAGFAASPGALEAAEGFGTAYMRDDVDWDNFLAQLGSPFRFDTTGPLIKRYPTCGGNLRAVVNLLTILGEDEVNAEEVQEAEVVVNPSLLHILRYEWPVDEYEAKYSLPFNIAATLVAGPPTVESFGPAALNDPRVLAARQKVRITVAGNSRRNAATVTLRLKDGRSLTCSDDAVPGEFAHPIGGEGIRAKFRANTAAALPGDLVDRAVRQVGSIDDASRDVAGLWAAVCEAVQIR
jgi:2-methylcitrate dehydratase PrpD